MILKGGGGLLQEGRSLRENPHRADAGTVHHIRKHSTTSGDSVSRPQVDMHTLNAREGTRETQTTYTTTLHWSQTFLLQWGIPNSAVLLYHAIYACYQCQHIILQCFRATLDVPHWATRLCTLLCFSASCAHHCTAYRHGCFLLHNLVSESAHPRYLLDLLLQSFGQCRNSNSSWSPPPPTKKTEANDVRGILA